MNLRAAYNDSIIQMLIEYNPFRAPAARIFDIPAGHTTREVNLMNKYPDLHELLRNDKEARDFFASLPLYVRTAINDRPGTVNSIASLRDYADNLTRNE